MMSHDSEKSYYPEEPDLVITLRSALNSSSPLDLLLVASSLLSLPEEEPDPFSGKPPGSLDRLSPIVTELVDALVAMPTPETDSLLVAFSEMLGDPSLRATVRKKVRPRLRVMPAWLMELSRLRVKRALVLADMLGGEETIALECAGPRGGFTLMVGIETLGNPFVEDTFGILMNIDQMTADLAERFSEHQMGDMLAQPLELADARARIEEALEITDMMVPPIETESWPGTRPLLEWQLRSMPSHGEGYVREEWDDEDREALLDEFMASPHATGFTHNDRMLADLLLDLAVNYGTGDLRQWGPRFVERLLMDLLPRKVHFSPEDMQAFPRILMALATFGGETSGVPQSSVERVTRAVERLLPEYLELVEPAAREAAMPWLTEILQAGPPPTMFDVLADAVGGEDALANLEVAPLPEDEPFIFEDVPDDVRGRVEAISELVAQYSADFFGDPEMRTAAKRTLHLLATEKPEVFRRRSKDQNVAAAILYITGHNNRWFDRSDAERTVAALAKTTGTRPVPWERAFTMTEGLYTPLTPYGEVASLSLGRPQLLTSWRRQNLLDKQQALEALAKWEDGDPDYNPWG